MNNDKKLYLFATLVSIGVLATGFVVSNASGVEAFTHLFRSNNQNNWTITSSDLASDQDTITKVTRNGNPIVFNKSNNSIGNVDPITGLSSVSFESSNTYVLISTGFNNEGMLYERYIKNDGTNEFNISLIGESFINISSLEDETLVIDNIDISYSCSMSQEEICDSRLKFNYVSKTSSYSVEAASNKFSSTDKNKVCMIPMYFDDGVNGKHPVTTIVGYGFSGTYFETLYLPSSITTLETGAFSQCFRMNHVYMPDSITAFNSYTFSRCSYLTDIRLPKTLTKISDNTFYNCTGLVDIHLPDSLSIIGSSTFSGCSLLEHCNCPKSLKKLGGSTFYHCNSLISYTVGINITDLGYHSFRDCSNVESINYEGTIEQWNKINSRQYFSSGCAKLTTVHCLDGDITL